ncbi:transglycosylase domain-containing protein [Acidaminobacter hydrogenoformans]|uniref:Penicillin-binding protein 1A n=1 Tax=Acidaminobacter hydrogenoformans DSM 2784 TaxID=1120920 RepID=A0A1G5S4T0_9FIRM|nr:transglycosylase domain-containing protein [Acidaminobacter hydrogenoformans]SCZ81326.1 penicillin-binding protein 1A [Acidaminobacter hydrogenoformans DSM 2784]
MDKKPTRPAGSARPANPHRTEGRNGSGASDNGKARRSSGNKKKKKKTVGQKIRKAFLNLILLFVILGLFGAGVVYAYVKNVVSDLPPIDPSKINELLGENSIILDSNGELLETLQSDGLRTIIRYEDMSPSLINAFVAVEDKTFFEHGGFNYVRLVGSVVNSVTKGVRIQGTSTITQQLARNLYLVESKSKRTMDRKIKEAYYTLELEKLLNKKQIIEAYLNTIWLGAGANGVQAAAQSYFSKDASQLDLVESAILAGIPSSPANYTPMLRLEKADIGEGSRIIDDSDSQYTLVYNDTAQKRYNVVLKLMLENGFITQEEYDRSKDIDLYDRIVPSKLSNDDITSYFADMVRDEVLEALMAQYSYTKEEANSMLFTKGLKIYTTIDIDLQKKLENTYDKLYDSMPKVAVRFNPNGNVITPDNRILLYKYENLVNEAGQLVIPDGDYKYDEWGNLVIFKDRRFNLYANRQDGKVVSVQMVIENVFKASELETSPSGVKNISNFKTYAGREVAVPHTVKTLDEQGNLVISKSFLNENPSFFTQGPNNELLVAKEHFGFSEQAIVQPQSSTVIIDYYTGHLKAVVGGRNITGQKIYNRAVNPRQPGSSIKPLAVYLPAIDTKKFTAASVIDDAPVYLKGGTDRWPLNWYEGSTKYWGLQTIRESIEWSINVNAAKVAQAVGLQTSVDYLKKLGVTSVVETGAYNDMNLAAMSLGGMSRGISPLEMAQAYGAIANGGVLNKTTTFTKVIDNRGNVILENAPYLTRVADEKAAYILQDMLRTTVTDGLAKVAAIRNGNTGIPVAGKTGTTSNQIDAWFVGFTPYYTASVWFGNDVNMPLDQGSKVAAQFWNQVMTTVHEGYQNKNFTPVNGLVSLSVDTKSGKLPSEFSALDPRGTVKTEMFIPGTEPTMMDDVHVQGLVCIESNLLANEYCPEETIETRVFVKRPIPLSPEDLAMVRDAAYELPAVSCDLHNESTYIPPAPAHITPMGDGRYYVILPFELKFLDGSSFTTPVDSIINADLSIQLPDGTIREPRSFQYPPDIETLLGTKPSFRTPPESGDGTAVPELDPDALIEEADAPVAN